MRVLHLVSYYPPDRIGGVGEIVADLHSGLLERGVDSHVLTSGTTTDDPRVRRLGRSPGSYILMSAAGWSHAREFDLIHAQHGEAFPLISLAGRRKRPPVLVTFHVSNREIGRSHRPFVVDGRRVRGGLKALTQRFLTAPAKMALDRRAMRGASAINFASRSAASDLLGDGSDATVIYTGLPNVSAEGEDVPPVELLYVGTTSHRKRTALLPAILDRVRDHLPQARLRIVGFHLESAPEIRRELERRRLMDAVTFEGPKLSEELGPYYRASKCLVVPSAYEGLPMVMLEAGWAELPVVATDAGGVGEFITDGESGLIVPVDDIDAIGAACVRMLKSGQEMGRVARSIVEQKFDPRDQVTAYMSLYERLSRNGIAEGE